MKSTQNISFIRWGNLNPRKHKEGRKESEDADRTYHTAPCFKGIYAFPKGYMERCLLYGVHPVNGKIQDRNFFLKDEEGNKIDYYDFALWDDEKEDLYVNPKYKLLLKKKGIKFKDTSSSYDEKTETCYVTYNTNKHVFNYTGLIWHHLEADEKEVISKKGSWIKTTFKAYILALNRALTKERFAQYMQHADRHGNPHSMPCTFNKGILEVFIERI